MASGPFEVRLRCCICLDTYRDPASLPCGHNFCLDCIEGFWDTKDESECPLCKETFGQRPELRVNRGFAEIVGFLKSSTQEENADAAAPPGGRKHQASEEVPCDICTANKSKSVKSCLVCQASYCELHLAPHLRDPALQRHRLTDPATFPSSHLCRNHNRPLTLFCKRDLTPVCQRCTERDHKHHEAVPLERESRRVKTHLKETKADIQQMIHARLQKMEHIKNSVDQSKVITEREIQSSVQVCSSLVKAIERRRAALLEELQRRQEEAERRADFLLHQLEQEVGRLRARSGELQQLELTESPLHLLQSFPSLTQLHPSREWAEVAVHSDNSVGTVRRAVSRMVLVCQELADELCAEEADKMNQYGVDVTLDPETASGWLVLSPDRKTVSLSGHKRKVPDSPLRFDCCVCVLGAQSFTSGRRYWVVQVGDKTDWDLGVARKSISRKGVVSVRPDAGYWALCRKKGGSLSACTSPSLSLALPRTPQKVAVFLDYEEGSVSFYDAQEKTHIYTFSGCTFGEPLHPYFNPCVRDNGRNLAPLVICPLEGPEGPRRDHSV